MRRPLWKQVWPWAVSLLLLIALVASFSGGQIQYHKWRLQIVKVRKARLLHYRGYEGRSQPIARNDRLRRS